MASSPSRPVVAIVLCVVGVALTAGSLSVVHVKYANNGYRGDFNGTFSATLWRVCIKVRQSTVIHGGGGGTVAAVTTAATTATAARRLLLGAGSLWGWDGFQGPGAPRCRGRWRWRCRWRWR